MPSATSRIRRRSLTRPYLKEAVILLENVPEEQKDYHPGSNNTVRNMVHLSLFPVAFNRARVLPDRLLSLDDYLDSIGEGN